MPFLMVPTTSSNSIDKWVFFWGKVDFSQFYHIFSYFFKYVWLLVPSYSTQMIFYDLEYYNSIRSLKWHQFQVFTHLQAVTINGFMWNPAIWNEYRGFLENAYKRFI